MGRIAYVNGQYVPHADATVHVEDRGYQFADGVYEVIAIIGGRQIDATGHLERLDRSLRELGIPRPMSDRALTLVIEEVIRRNRVRDGTVYIQVTRGVAKRDHAFPAEPEPAVVIYAGAKALDGRRALAERGVSVVTRPDIRWGRADIKSVSLLPNCLAKQAAKEAGAYEAFLVDRDGFVTEGSSTNAWIVDQDGHVITRPAGYDILNGITRLALMALAGQDGIELIERPFTVDELRTAREVFLTSSSAFALPVVQVDDRIIGNGRPGSVTRRIIELFEHYARAEEANAAAGRLAV